MRKNILIAILILTAAPALFAASANSPANADNVQASVANVCRVATFNLSFGAYDPVTANSATGSDITPAGVALDVFCTKGGSPTKVTLNTGVGASTNTFGTRAMLNGAVKLEYDLFVDSGLTTNWTTGLAAFTASTAANVALTDGTGTAIKVYGKLPKGQNSVTAGSYVDTVVATVNF